ncbi:stage V sporulation protein T [Pseudogracilibacillus auburnensis]|uniref:AbrB family transcriptional regulator n=1 Tax=Pseudogracilibacillus auburnensis TaxID=1494959 RepID=A0A2V3VIC2_9BACI|nr:stage V sporulation protein T [Pseudogracilibacillus auburnensis]MBO1004452.1 stage V sporulation protein T [Pseudogracilibacillus auburnensis]PXW81553.1 AbrB family transcriptional regulator [Pseudogracilibacillus auburnensis]
MKATGIVRRIDDLGRVVIPKEIRRTLRIREGDPLEIFVAREGEVILKKYSPINELGHFATEYADALFDSLHFPVFICDRDEIIAVSGDSKKDYLNKSIGTHIEDAIENRSNVLETEKTTIELIRGKEDEIDSYVISVIIANGDPIGSVIVLSKNGDALSNVEQKVAETASNFLGKQME